MPMEALQDNKNKTVKLLELFTTTPVFRFKGTIKINVTFVHLIYFIYSIYIISQYYRKLDGGEIRSYCMLVIYELLTASTSIS